MKLTLKIVFALSILLNVALLVAALYYRSMHHPNERNDKECVVSWNNCIMQMNEQFDVVFFGDSHTAYGHFQTAFPSVHSINLGYMGESTKGMLRRVPVIQSVCPHTVFLMAGLNGLAEQSMSDFESAYCTLVDSILSAVPDAELYILNILPVNDDVALNQKIINANQIVQAIAEARNLTYIDIYSLYVVNNELPQDVTHDGVHLIPEAYASWYDLIRPFIQSLTL